MKRGHIVLLTLALLGILSCKQSTEVVGGRIAPQIDSISYYLFFAPQSHGVTYTFANDNNLINIQEDSGVSMGVWSGYDLCKASWSGDSILLDGTTHRFDFSEEFNDTSRCALLVDTVSHKLTAHLIFYSHNFKQDSATYEWHRAYLTYNIADIPFRMSDESYTVNISGDSLASRMTGYAFDDTIRYRSAPMNYARRETSTTLAPADNYQMQLMLTIHRKTQ